MASATENLRNAKLTENDLYLKTNNLIDTGGILTSYGTSSLMEFLRQKFEDDFVAALKAVEPKEPVVSSGDDGPF